MVPQACHWLTAGLVILPWASGTLDDELPKGAAYAMGLSIHILGGLMILAVLVVRLLWRLVDPPPPPEPTALGEWLDRAGRLAHCVLYALVIAVPVAGIALQFARGDALPLFGLSEMPSPGPANRALARTVKEAHEVFAHALVIFAGISCGRGADPSLGLRRPHLCADAVEIKAIIGFWRHRRRCVTIQ